MVDRSRIVRLLSILWKRSPDSWSVEFAWVRGLPSLGILAGGMTCATTSFEVLDGRIVRIATITSPEEQVGSST